MSYKEPTDLANSVTGTLGATNGGTGQSTITTGDLIYGSASNTLSKLGIGSSNQVLKVSGGVPTWAAAASGGVNYLNSNPDFEGNSVSPWVLGADTQTATMTIASPAVVTVTSTTGLLAGDPFTFTTSGALPTGVTAGTTYYISTIVSSTTFRFSASLGGSDVNTSGSQSGTHKFRPFRPTLATGTDGNTATFAASSTTPLRGTYSGLLTKGASDLAGEFIQYPFTIESADSGQVLQVSFDYLIKSGTYVDNDADVWLIDVTNGARIQPTPFHIMSTGTSYTIPQKWIGNFQTSTSSTSYKLVIHIASASSSAYSILVDNFSVGPQLKSYGPFISDWVSYTPTLSAGWGTSTNVSFLYKREGDTLIVKGTFTAGTVAASLASITLPSGLSVDSSKISLSNTTSNVGEQVGTWWATSANNQGAIVTATGTSTSLLYFGTGMGGVSSMLIPGNGTSITSTGSNLIYSLMFRIPVTGWSSGQLLSSDSGDSRVIAASYYMSSGSVTSGNPIDFSTKDFDTAASVTTGASWKFTASVQGYYQISGHSWTSSGTPNLLLYKNGSSNRYLVALGSLIASFNTTIYLVAGDYIDLRTDGSATLTTGSSGSRVNISRVSGGNQQIAASESVSALYTGAPPTGTLSGAFNAVTFGTKVKDSHSSYSSSTWTSPISGVFSISTSIDVTGTYSAANRTLVEIYVNGSAVSRGGGFAGSSSTSNIVAHTSIEAYPILAGQTVQVKSFTEATSPTFSSNSQSNYISIVRVGNY